MMLAAQYHLPNLLERAGARIRRRGRADCPKCKRQRAVSFDETKGVYHCHGQGCDFSGGSAKLAHEQGLYERLTQGQYRELRRERERADRAARMLYERIKVRRFELLDRLQTLSGLESTAQGLGPENPETWDALNTVYAKRPVILAELAIIENVSAADLIAFLSANAGTRELVIDRVLSHGGLRDSHGRFVELAL
jgi:hypothetical protein